MAKANTHGYINTTHCACWDNDCYNFVGVNATTDIDNGTFLTLAKINSEADGFINGYEFEVEINTGGEADAQIYVADTPIPGTSTDLAIQLYSDPRYFYNEAGKPISVKRVINGDCIELDKNAFAENKSPEDVTGAKGATIGASGKLEASATDDSKFALLGYKYNGIGQEDVKVWVLMYMGQ